MESPNSNVAEVSIIKSNLILILAVGSRVSGITIFSKMHQKHIFFSFWGGGVVRNGTSDSQNQNLRPIYNRYFCHITIIKWSQNCTRAIRKSFFFKGYCVFFSSSFHWNPHNNPQKVATWLKMGQSLKQKPFWKWKSGPITLAACRIFKIHKVPLRITLLHYSTLVLEYYSTPFLLHYKTHVQLHYSTPVLLHYCTPVLQRYSTPVLLYYSTPVLLHYFTPVLWHYCNTVI